MVQTEYTMTPPGRTASAAAASRSRWSAASGAIWSGRMRQRASEAQTVCGCRDKPDPPRMDVGGKDPSVFAHSLPDGGRLPARGGGDVDDGLTRLRPEDLDHRLAGLVLGRRRALRDRCEPRR